MACRPVPGTIAPARWKCRCLHRLAGGGVVRGHRAFSARPGGVEADGVSVLSFLARRTEPFRYSSDKLPQIAELNLPKH